MDLLSHRQWDMVLYLVLPLSPLQCTVSEFEEMRKRLREFEETEISRQSCRGDYE